jgi:hypothetical protein
MNRGNMAKQIMEGPMKKGSKKLSAMRKGYMGGGKVKAGYKCGGKVKMAKGGQIMCSPRKQMAMGQG